MHALPIENSNEWYAKHLKSVLAIENVDPASSEHPVDRPGFVPEPPLLALGDVVAPAVVDELFLRCWTSKGADTLRLKVWFDNCSGGVKQRAFTNCPVHGCIKYIPVLDTRLRTCAALWLWRTHADNHECTRSGHLSWFPTDEVVDAALDTFVLEPF
jgi:hypothetical protein